MPFVDVPELASECCVCPPCADGRPEGEAGSKTGAAARERRRVALERRPEGRRESEFCIFLLDALCARSCHALGPL